MKPILKHKWLLLAPVMGAVLTLSFAPYHYAWTALPALMFLYRAWQTHSAKQGFVIGYLFGLGNYGLGIWWVFISVHDYGGADAISASLLTLLLVAVWSLFSGLTGYLTVKILRHHTPALRLTSAALLWVAVEYFRGYWLLNGFPWLQIAYSQLSTPLAGFVPIMGVYGTGFLLAISAFVLVEGSYRQLPAKAGLVILSLIWGGGSALKTMQWTHPAGAPIKATLVQGNIKQDIKWSTEQRLKTLQLYQDLTEQHWDSKIILWPETAIPAFLSQVKGFYLDPLATKAQKHGTDLVVSLPTGDATEYFNSVLTLSNPDRLYHKNHLLPFGEYLPLQPLSGWILNTLQIPLGTFTPGADIQPLLTAGGYAFITTICYEDAFGEQTNRQIADAAYIVNVTNDAWFGNSSQPYQHMQMAQMRALETGRYLLRATNTGLTGFVKPDGSVSKQAPLFTTTTLTDEVVPMTGITPYSWLGDNLVFAGILGVVLGIWGWVVLYKPATVVGQ